MRPCARSCARRSRSWSAWRRRRHGDRSRCGPRWPALRTLGYVPFFAPNPAGYPAGVALFGPQQLLHAFDLAAAVDPVRAPQRIRRSSGRARAFRCVRRRRDDPRRDRAHLGPEAADPARTRLAGVLHPMSPRRISRREFLAGLGATGVVAAAGGYGISTWSRPRRASRSRPRAAAGAGAAARRPGEPRRGARSCCSSSRAATTPSTWSCRTIPRTTRSGPPSASPIPSRSTPGSACRPSSSRSRRSTARAASRSSRASACRNPTSRISRRCNVGGPADPDLHTRTGWVGRYLDRAVGDRRPDRGCRDRAGPVAGAAAARSRSRPRSPMPPASSPRASTPTCATRCWSRGRAWSPRNRAAGLLGQMQRAIGESLDARSRIARDLGVATAPRRDSTTRSRRTRSRTRSTSRPASRRRRTIPG